LIYNIVSLWARLLLIANSSNTERETMSNFFSPARSGSWQQIGLLAACTIGFAASAHAGVAATASVNTGSSASQVTDYGTIVNNQAHASASLPNNNASAGAAYGALNITGKGSISALAGNGGAHASFTDALRFENAALTGKAGMATIAYYLDYDFSVGASGDGDSNGSLSFLARAGNNYSWTLDYKTTSGTGYLMYEYRDPFGQGRSYGAPPSNYLYVTTDFTWGGGFNTGFEIQSSIGTYVPFNGHGTATYDLAGMGYWAGIVSVTADGRNVSDYTLSSLSGKDYSTSFVPANDVPEPTTIAIFLAGLALLGVQRARKA
jgi:hypothetical protein